MKRLRISPEFASQTCIISGKLQYSTEAIAMRALARARSRHAKGVQEKRVYKCPECNMFHLTSKAVWR